MQWRSQDFKVGGHTGDATRRADPGVGFWGSGSAAGPLPVNYEVWRELSLPPLPPPKKSPRICTNPVAMPVDGGGGERAPLCPPVASLLPLCVSLNFP